MGKAVQKSTDFNLKKLGVLFPGFINYDIERSPAVQAVAESKFGQSVRQGRWNCGDSSVASQSNGVTCILSGFSRR